MSNADNEKGNETPETKKRPAITFWAGLGSVLWVSATVMFVYTSPLPEACAGPVRCMSLNEWGDFIAGVSAPLAFLWLVVAVFIQSHELSEQREELRLTRLEFKENRKVMNDQAEEARKQAEFIGIQTDLLQKRALDEERLRQEMKLEDALQELGLMIEQHLHQGDILTGIKLNGTRGGSPMFQRGNDRDGWIIAFAAYLHEFENTGLTRPFVVAAPKVAAVGRVYDLCRQLGEIALVNGIEAIHKLDRLRVSDIRIFIETNLAGYELNSNDDTSSSRAELGLRLSRPPRQVDQDDADTQPT